MAWRSAPSVAAALREATTRWPDRNRASDGTIGDAAHSARQSDHNPDDRGVVHAFDLTHDPTHGVDCAVLAEHLIQRRDARVKYIIFNHRICSPSSWSWRQYTGSNPHTHHMHVSINYTTAAEDDVSSWWDLGTPTPVTPPSTPSAPGGGGAPGGSPGGSPGGAPGGGAGGPSSDGPVHRFGSVVVAIVTAAVAAAMEAAKKAAEAAAASGGGGSGGGQPSPPPGPLAKGQRRPLPPGYGPVKKVTAEIVAKCNELLKSSHPIGTHIPMTLSGRDLLFAVEWHKHAPTDNVSAALKDWHRGISTYEKK